MSSTRRVSVRKARSEGAVDLQITATEPFPVASVEAQERGHEIDARQIVAAMRASLPTGTIDRILILLLERAYERVIDRSATDPGEPSVPPTRRTTVQELRALAQDLRRRLDVVDEAAILLDELDALVLPTPGTRP